MIYKLYAIRDKKSEFAAPIPIKDHEGAIRWFDHEIKTKEFMRTYADDFELYHVGSFDTDNGHTTGLEIPELVITGEEVTYVSKENNAI